MAAGKKGTGDKGKARARRVSHGVKRKDTHGAKTIETLSRISQKKQDEEVEGLRLQRDRATASLHAEGGGVDPHVVEQEQRQRFSGAPAPR